MTSKEALKELCKDCERHLHSSQQRCPFRSISNDYCDEYNVVEKDLIKLNKLEHIKKELGIDLVTLFKALKKGIWTKSIDCFCGSKLEKTPIFITGVEVGYRNYYEVNENYNIVIEEKNVLCLYIHDYDYISNIVRIKDYGRTWALTKKELKNEKDN